MSGPGVGFEYPPQPVAWLKRDALLFANSIGCKADELHFLYVSTHDYDHLRHVPGTDKLRNFIPSLPCSRLIPSSCVSTVVFSSAGDEPC